MADTEATTVHTAGVVRDDDPVIITERVAVAAFIAGYTVNVRRAKVHDESRTLGLDRNGLGALLVQAGLGDLRDGALITVLALNGLRISEAARPIRPRRLDQSAATSLPSTSPTDTRMTDDHQEDDPTRRTRLLRRPDNQTPQRAPPASAKISP